MVRSLILSSSIGMAAGHASMTFPKPRNSIDGSLAPWKDWAYPCDASHKGVDCVITGVVKPPHVFGSCSISAHNGVKEALTASSGQACYWYLVITGFQFAFQFGIHVWYLFLRTLTGLTTAVPWVVTLARAMALRAMLVTVINPGSTKAIRQRVP